MSIVGFACASPDKPMNDPEVVALNYVVKVREGVTFSDPPPLHHETSALRARLENGRLRIEPVAHYADAGAARASVEPFVRAWELDAALVSHRRDFWFEFENAEVRDRSPTPGPHMAAGSSVIKMTVSGTASFLVKRAAYPAPPKGFVVTDQVRHLWDRYEASIDGREPATSAGYYCYTALTALAPPGTKKGARVSWVASALNVEDQILRTLSDLTNVGDHRSARKYSPKPRMHTGAEVNWLRMAIRALTHRLGEWEFDRDASLPQLTMSALPPL